MNDITLPDRQSARMSRRHLKVMLSLMVTGGLLRLSLILLTPLYPAETLLPGYNDEPLHLHYVEHIAAGGGWPIYNSQLAAADTLSHEFPQPPLYYALAAPLWQLMHRLLGQGIIGARAVSALCGLLAALFTYRAALLWSNDRKTALGSMTAMLFAPTAAMFSSLVTNDALLMLMAALSLHSLILSRSADSDGRRQVLTGLFLGGAVWAKMSGLALIPLAFFAGKPSVPPTAQWLARGRTLLTALLVILPLALWNISHYGRPLGPGIDTLPAQYAPQSAVGVTGGAVGHPAKALKIFLRTAAQPLMSRWGSRLEKGTSAAWLLIWGALTAAGLAAAALLKPTGYPLLAVIFVTTAAFIYWNIHLFQVEFRLLAPAFPAMAALTARIAGWMRISPGSQALLWAAPLVVMLITG